MATENRRVQRTQSDLCQALRDLLQQRRYDEVTVQMITAHANVGRTTFYSHYTSKADLYIHAHHQMTAQWTDRLLSKDELVGEATPPFLLKLYAYHWDEREVLRDVYFSKDATFILGQMRQGLTQQYLGSLQSVFEENADSHPFLFLATYMAGAEMTLMIDWIAKHFPYEPNTLAQMVHDLHRAIVLQSYPQ